MESLWIIVNHGQSWKFQPKFGERFAVIWEVYKQWDIPSIHLGYFQHIPTILYTLNMSTGFSWRLRQLSPVLHGKADGTGLQQLRLGSGGFLTMAFKVKITMVELRLVDESGGFGKTRFTRWFQSVELWDTHRCFLLFLGVLGQRSCFCWQRLLWRICLLHFAS